MYGDNRPETIEEALEQDEEQDQIMSAETKNEHKQILLSTYNKESKWRRRKNCTLFLMWLSRLIVVIKDTDDHCSKSFNTVFNLRHIKELIISYL